MKLLVVEDDKDLNHSLQQFLELENYAVTGVFSFAAACDLDIRLFDLIIVDWNLCDGQGLDLLKLWKRQDAKKPILFLTARADVIDKVLAFELGANDYLTKPFEPRELLARIRCQLREQSAGQKKLEFHGLCIQPSERRVEYLNKEIALSKMEYDLIYFFIQNPNKVFSREELLREVWGYNSSPTTRTVDTHILQLRQKIDTELFQTVHGIGYRLKALQ